MAIVHRHAETTLISTTLHLHCNVLAATTIIFCTTMYISLHAFIVILPSQYQCARNSKIAARVNSTRCVVCTHRPVARKCGNGTVFQIPSLMLSFIFPLTKPHWLLMFIRPTENTLPTNTLSSVVNLFSARTSVYVCEGAHRFI